MSRRRDRTTILATTIVLAVASIAMSTIAIVRTRNPPTASDDPITGTHPLKGPAWLIGVILGLIGVVNVVATITALL